MWEPWQVASNTSINRDYGPGHTLFSTFSAVCWFFGRELSLQLSPSGDVPVGLISNNWVGTKVEVWSPQAAYAKCNRTDLPANGGQMYNAMILPYAAGPMAISGFAWYQGEADTENATTAECNHVYTTTKARVDHDLVLRESTVTRPGREYAGRAELEETKSVLADSCGFR